MHHCVKSDEEKENVERTKALSLIPAQSSLIASIFLPSRRENNRDLCFAGVCDMHGKQELRAFQAIQ